VIKIVWAAPPVPACGGLRSRNSEGLWSVSSNSSAWCRVYGWARCVKRAFWWIGHFRSAIAFPWLLLERPNRSNRYWPCCSGDPICLINVLASRHIRRWNFELSACEGFCCRAVCVEACGQWPQPELAKVVGFISVDKVRRWTMHSDGVRLRWQEMWLQIPRTDMARDTGLCCQRHKSRDFGWCYLAEVSSTGLRNWVSSHFHNAFGTLMFVFCAFALCIFSLRFWRCFGRFCFRLVEGEAGALCWKLFNPLTAKFAWYPFWCSLARSPLPSCLWSGHTERCFLTLIRFPGKRCWLTSWMWIYRSVIRLCLWMGRDGKGWYKHQSKIFRYREVFGFLWLAVFGYYLLLITCVLLEGYANRKNWIQQAGWRPGRAWEEPLTVWAS